MDTNRLVNIIFTDLTLENLKLQDKMDSLINSNDSTDIKTHAIKKALEQLALNELMINKFQSLVQSTNNMEQTQGEKNGKI